MHGCGSGSALLVNAEVDSMGGVVDGGVGIGIKTSPRRAAIEKAQAELRQEYDVREERRRELEFLEKGGNPLDFKFGNAASVSVQSTSLTDHHVEHFVTSEAKGSFPLTASPHGDSVESSGRPGAPAVCEPNSADNFDGENQLHDGARKIKHPSRRGNIAPSEQSSRMDRVQKAKESEDSAIFRPYARRNRSRPNRDGARSSSNDVVQSSGGHGCSLLVRGVLRDVKGSMSETNNHKDQNLPASSKPKLITSNGDMVSQVDVSNTQSSVKLDVVKPLEAIRTPAVDRLDATESISLKDKQDVQPSEVDVHKAPIDVDLGEGNHVGEERVVSAGLRCAPCAVSTKNENETSPGLHNGSSELKRDDNEAQICNAAIGAKRLDSESSCTQNSLILDVNNDNDLYINRKDDNTNGILMPQVSKFDGVQNLVMCEKGNEKYEMEAADGTVAINDDNGSVHQSISGTGSVVKVEEEIIRSSEMQDEVKCVSGIEGLDQNEHTASEADRKPGNALGDEPNLNKQEIFPGGPQVSIQELPESNTSKNSLSTAPDIQPTSGVRMKLADKAHEDSILEEARTIEAKRKRIAELSVRTVLSESHRKSQWDFVLEEMAWLANDFAQERIWKITAAAQICRRASFNSQLRVEQQNQHVKLKRVAYTLAKAVMQFWHEAEVLLTDNDQTASLKNCKNESRIFDENEFSVTKFGGPDKESCKELGQQNPVNAIHGYAVRFLRCNSSTVPSLQAEALTTPERIAGSGIMDISWDDQLTEESLFYAVPSGAMESYRTSIESHLVQCEKTRNCMQEEVDTSMYDAAAEFGYHENAYDEEEEETSTFYLHGVFDGIKPTKHDQKKRKHLVKSFSGRTYELGTEVSYENFSVASQHNILMGKRPANNLNVGQIPTKRMRTASRQRVISPFSSGTMGVLQAPAKNDASSGDTSSFQDDQSTLHGGSQMQRSMEVESVVDFEKQLPYDCAETSTKPKKKKKSKNLGSTFEQGWQLDSTVHNELRDNSKKRLESHHFDSNGTSGLYGQHTAKKPKMAKQLLDNSFNNMAPVSGSLPSPAASHMSNMSNTNRLMKLIGARERARKTKSLKVSAGQPGCGSPWSLFEDQALVVLVHDMGPNWELVSDAINSTLQFKCIFRKPKECRERHKVLMDKSAGDGADSAEDSGSSQSYPSTLPGIPKGSARQLFQRLQGPMEEDTLKSHFEKIILIGKKLHYWRNQSDYQDPKQIAAVHNSHVIALSQVCPNNLNGGFLTPLDLCDATTSSPDALALGYQGSHSSALTMPNQGTAPSILPASGANSPLQASSGMVLGSNPSSTSASLNAPARDSKYSVPRTSLPADEQQRMQHYNQLMSSRNMQHSNLPGSGSLSGAERGVRMLPGGNGIGMVPGMNRNVPLPRPGYPGIASPSSMLNSGSMLSSSMAGMPTPVNIHTGTGSGQGNSMMRPRESSHMMRPGHNPEHQRQMVVPELQMQATQGTSPGIPAFNGMSSAFANQTTPPPVQTYPGHPQQQHQVSPQQSHMLGNPHHPLQTPNHVTSQQAYAMRLAKERQMQQRLLHHQQQQQQQQQFASSNSSMSHAQHQPQLPISSSQNSSQIQPQTSSQPVSLPPLTPSSLMTPAALQQQQKHNLPHQGLGRNPQTGASGLNNPMGKQRQRQTQQQQFQQTARHHPQQRQHSQSPQQAKHLKGMGRGNMAVHQNLPMDHSHLNGITVPPGNQGAEKGDQMMNIMQGQGIYSGVGLGPIQPSKPLVPMQSLNHSQQQHKLYSSSTMHSAKPAQQMPSHSDNSSQGSLSSGHSVPTTNQAAPAAIMGSSHQHLPSNLPPHQKPVNQAQTTVQRVVHQNRQVNHDLPIKSAADLGMDHQQSANNISQKSSSTASGMPQSSNDSANVTPVVSSAIVSHWKPSESSSYDSGMANSIRSPAISNSAGSESVASVSQGLGQRQVSGSFSQHGHNTAGSWQQHAELQKSTPPPPPPPQQLFQPLEQHPQPEQQPPEQQSHSQQQTQPLQPSQGGVYIQPTNSNLE